MGVKSKIFVIVLLISIGLMLGAMVMVASRPTSALPDDTQYQLTMISDIGTTTDSGLYDAGSEVQISATPSTAEPGEQYVFAGWVGMGTGCYNGLANPATVTMNGPITETASWTHQFQLTISAITGTTTPEAGNSWINAGTKITITTSAPTDGNYVFNGWVGAGTGSYGGPAITAMATMNGPITEIASWTYQPPTQYQLTVSANVGTTTGTGQFDAGSTQSISATAPNVNDGEQYLWNGWTGTGLGSYHGLDRTPTITMSEPITETANWIHQYKVSFAVSPEGGGVISPSGTGVWENAGTLSIEATPSAGYAYSSWTSDNRQISFDVQSASTEATIEGPGTITAAFSQLLVGVTVSSSPSGTGYVLVDGNAITTPKTFNWLPGAIHSLEAATILPTGANEQYIFATWSDTAARVHTFTVTSTSATITATFTHQYQLTMAADQGTTNPAIGNSWRNAGSTVSISATAPTGASYTFNGWVGTSTGSFNGKDNPVSVTMNGPIAETASWTVQPPTQYKLTVIADIGTTTGTGQFDAGSTQSLTALAPTVGAGVRYVFNGWVGTGTGSFNGKDNPASVTMNGPITETASWTKQCLASFVVTPSAGGTVSPSGSVWVNAGPLSIQATPSTGYAFSSWSSNTTSITFDAQTSSTMANLENPCRITAAFDLLSVSVTITSNPAGTGYALVDGAATATPKTFTWLPGTVHSLEAAANVTIGAGERSVFTAWSDTAARIHSYTVTSTSTTITANFVHQFHLTIATNFGTTSPAVGDSWLDVGSSVTITASAPTAGTGERYAFNGWTGSGTGNYTGKANPTTNVVINGAISEIASWTQEKVPGTPTGLTAVSGDGRATLNWTAPSDGGAAIDHYVVYQDGAQAWNVTTLLTTINGLTNGQTYSFTVVAHNPVGNGPAPAAVTIRPVKGWSGPALEITSPKSGSLNRTGSVMMAWAASDTSSNVVKIEVSSDALNWIKVNGTSYLIKGLSDGPHALTVRVTDAGNNVIARSVPILVDSTAPMVTIMTPSSEAYLNTHLVTVSWIIRENGSGLSKSEMNSNGTSWTVQTGNSSFLTLQDGDHDVYVRATDNAGNVMTAMVPFTVDTTAPSLLRMSPVGSAVSTLASVNVTFSEAMNREYTNIAIAGIDGRVVWNGDNVSFTPSAALKGRTLYNVTINGMDLAGNTRSQTWTFRTAVVGEISGIVYGHDRKPLPKVVLKLIGQSTASQTEMGYRSLAASTSLQTVRETTTNASGAYAFYDVAIGNYTLEFTEIGYLKKSMAVAMTPDAVDRGVLPVDPGAVVYNPSNGVLFILTVVLISAAMTGLILVVRRRKGLTGAINLQLKRTKIGGPTKKLDEKISQVKNTGPPDRKK